ncbi:hypothetical protein [Pontibacter akesuensis]|uniref:Uncharacterized protein n=1 Tax=Pontibacter akesuensis TaxID=388950 RepID=A0A1I7J5X1_9BACT|nr:hypothetical protein [Pontibacter akesuensis]GHA72242.1 hypothetical protein GCM10007389_27440 [Pontibacter akesuensis]SFU80554.1 hypothetical protein SAMN04487941_2519 [Pontibacter akesuensis]
MVELHSEADNIENTAQCIIEAFKQFEVREGSTLHYQQLYPYLQERYPHYKDVQKEAEHHLSKEGYVNPAPDGLMLTQVGHQHVWGNQ